MAYRPIVIQGVTYTLSHLNPFVMDVTPTTPGAPTYKVHVSFGPHTFSREWLVTDTPDYRVQEQNGDLRCFCTTRHGLSAHLPGMIQASAQGKAHFSLKDNYLVFRNVPGCTGPYTAFFSLKKARNTQYDAVMFIQSAYEKPALPKNLQSIGMPTLVSKVVRGEAIRRPRRR
ncbi:MAG: hypothetical protein J0I79_16570 [Mesorhizobium sp.]|uniref:hypothetical protein n=1 Tax=Mesorhizobium sp. TaxID=1871066 RepID=UPI001AC82255|nr:hypothetical protein [Mesorhizobium sp.]MBN9219561.1 hypothetical protein [Mesorhizobium sp.]